MTNAEMILKYVEVEIAYCQKMDSTYPQDNYYRMIRSLEGIKEYVEALVEREVVG